MKKKFEKMKGVDSRLIVAPKLNVTLEREGMKTCVTLFVSRTSIYV
jgi:hypothetical protein